MSEDLVTQTPEILEETRRQFIDYAKERATKEVDSPVPGARQFQGRENVNPVGQLVPITGIVYTYLEGTDTSREEANIEFRARYGSDDEVVVDGMVVPMEGNGWHTGGALDGSEVTQDSEVAGRLDALKRLAEAGAVIPVEQ